MNERQLTGPIEDQTWATKLQSHVVTPESSPRIHGYDVERDLMEHYGFVDTLMLCVLGDLPGDAERRAIEHALHVLAPMSVAHAPTHAAMLTRLCGASRSASIAAGALTLGEDARWLVETHAAFLAWLATPSSVVPAGFAAASAEERQAVDELRLRVARTGAVVPALAADLDLSKTATALAVLWTCGAKDVGQLELLLVLARLPCVGAEMLATSSAKFRTYPIDLPPFRFEAPR